MSLGPLWTKFLGRHLESYSFLRSPKFLTPVTLILYLFSENEPQNQTSTCNSVLCQQDLNRTIDRLSTGRLGQESEKKRRLQQVSRCINQCELQQLATALYRSYNANLLYLASRLRIELTFAQKIAMHDTEAGESHWSAESGDSLRAMLPTKNIHTHTHTTLTCG